MCSNFFIAALRVLGASGCGEQAKLPALWQADPRLADAKLARTTFTLGGTSIAISAARHLLWRQLIEPVLHLTGRPSKIDHAEPMTSETKCCLAFV
jgi:hypothetical protein